MVPLTRWPFFCGMMWLAANPLAAQPPRLQFQRLVAHWDAYHLPEYRAFIQEARPEIAQVGFYGAHFWSLAHTPHGKGYPAHFPVQGLNECGAWFADLNRELHRHKVKVVGHFNVEFLVGDPMSPDGLRGFFKFYRDLWDEKQLGPRPVADPLDLLQKNADGTPITNKTYSIGGMREYWGCLNNPHWRQVLKAWVKAGLERGVDGYISNYFYRHNCLCPHCQRGFRGHLKQRFSADELRTRFAIDDADKHVFTEIVGWHAPKESTPLRREMLRFSQISCKEAYDDVFVKYGRSLNPDLILAQWNHLGDFNQINGDEMCMLPKELWGRDLDYLWYSTGGAAAASDLAAGNLGEATLQARYLRGAFDNKPYTLGKYESTRTRNAIAELAANGGAPMGFYTRFQDPEARQEIVRYYNFLEKHADLYRGSRSRAEVLLLFPRTRVHEGDVAAVERFKKLGRELLDRHVLFDVLPDDLADNKTTASYRAVVATEGMLKLPGDLSRIAAPGTVRVSLNQVPASKTWTLHVVNYNRMEPPGKKLNPGRGIVDEKPIATPAFAVEVQLPAKARVERVQLLTPEAAEPVSVKYTVTSDRLRFEAPSILVYGVVRIDFAP